MAQAITSKGKKWEILNSIWILWTILTFGALNYVSFFYIAYRVKQRKWTILGIIYSIPFILLMATSDIIGKNSWLYDVIMLIYFIAWITSIFHAFRIRPEYLLRLEAYKVVKKKDIEQMRKDIASEYGQVNRGSHEEKVNKVNGIAYESLHKESREEKLITPIDMNTASENEISAIPHLGVILAKKAVAKREEIGSFLSIEHFGEQVGLKPHILERVRPYITVSEMERKETDEQTGRIVDF